MECCQSYNLPLKSSSSIFLDGMFNFIFEHLGKDWLASNESLIVGLNPNCVLRSFCPERILSKGDGQYPAFSPLDNMMWLIPEMARSFVLKSADGLDSPSLSIFSRYHLQKKVLKCVGQVNCKDKPWSFFKLEGVLIKASMLTLILHNSEFSVRYQGWKWVVVWKLEVS